MSNNEIFCPSCGAKNSKNNRYCSKCGASIPHNEEETESQDTYRASRSANQGTSNQSGQTYQAQQPGSQQPQSTQPQPNGSRGHVPQYERPPEGYKYADLGDRFFAFIIDSILFSVIVMLLGLLFGRRWLWDLDLATYYTDAGVSILVSFIYLSAFEYYNDGKTPGKALLKLKTVNETEFGPMNLKQVVLHNLGKVLILPIDLIIGIIVNNDEPDPRDKNKIRISQQLSKTLVLKKV